MSSIPTTPRFLLLLSGALLSLVCACTSTESPTESNESGRSDDRSGPTIQWGEWTPHIFRDASEVDRLVLLHLGTKWCHWCHVMHDTTYEDAAVKRLLDESFLAVRVDADAEPALANRYEAYGWPATIIFAPDGTELVKMRGYINQTRMASLLQAVIDDPTPGPSVIDEPEIEFGRDTSLAPEVRAELEQRIAVTYDDKLGGWGSVHRYLPWQNIEYELVRAMRGDEAAAARVNQTLEAQLQLMDPVWGGVYQYSHGGVWTNPHYEKLLHFQAQNLRIYSMAYAWSGDTRWREAGADILRYMRNFLQSPAGIFYVSQDADLVKGEHSEDYFALDDDDRRALGIPAVDQSVYARENGWAVQALCAWYAATGDESALQQAERAITISNAMFLGDPEGTGPWYHSRKAATAPLRRFDLGDTLEIGRAWQSLFQVTGNSRYLHASVAAARHLNRLFRNPQGGLLASERTLRSADGQSVPAPVPPVPNFDENVRAARWCNLLAHELERVPDHGHVPDEIRSIADHAMRWLCTPAVATARRLTVGALLLADEECRTDPMDITVVGRGDEATTLWRAAVRFPLDYCQRQWLLPFSDELRASDYASFPADEVAAFVCVDGACSLPLRTADDLEATAQEMLRSRR